jgi:cellulose synthase/poly-beta-1,6-N-acetylglucosamine synthase-like glycosyltransferase
VRVAVIIPARNAGRSLGKCLAALRCEGVPGSDCELIVVDDASEDFTAKVASQAGATVFHGQGRGPAAARNLGARRAKADVLVFLDADTSPEPGWLDALLRPFVDQSIVAVKGRYVTQQSGVVARFSQLEFEEKYARLERAKRIDFVDTGTAAYRRDVFLNAGGFDESFPAQSAEDVELAFRLAENGAKFAFSPSARVCHVHAETLLAYLHKKARYGYFRVTVYRRHPTKLRGDSYTPPWMGIQIVLAALLPLTLVGRAIGVPARLIVVLVVGFAATCAPLARRAWIHDRTLLPWVVPLSYLRAFAQGCGLALGLASSVLRKPNQRRS